ncbi:MAG TPA: ATP-binding protein, partial [Bacillota bacterium]|nr:ATP-binding protein [Bacillota bacterium]
PQSYTRWERLFSQHLRAEASLRLLSSASLKAVSAVDEDERDFRIRLQHLAHEKRDEAVEALRKRYASRINTLVDRERRARQALERQSAQAKQRKLDVAVSAGSALLGALLGKKAISATSVSKVGTAMRSAGRAAQSGDTIAQAQETLQVVQAQVQELENELEREIEKVTQSVMVQNEALDEIVIRATATGITTHLLCLAWVPHTRSAGGGLQPLHI